MSTPKLWIGTSWKMNKLLGEAAAWAEALRGGEPQHAAHIQRFVIPPFTAVRRVASILEGTSVKTGVQNMHWDDRGAWTGEISPPMVVDCGAQMVELGHSERRAHFGETDRTVGLKTAAAVRHGLIPLICIGETLEEREAGQADQVLARQVRGALGNLDAEQCADAPILFAYEPVWAIGDGGIPATADYADARQAEIGKLAGDVLGRRVPCLYGGSVNRGNCAELIACDHIDGLFIGRSAWEVEGYMDILARCADVT